VPLKPMKRRDYEKWIRQYGWKLEKTGTDWKLLDDQGKTQIRNIIVTHPGNEVIGLSVKKTRQALQDMGLE
jgi:hypothetical protein